MEVFSILFIAFMQTGLTDSEFKFYYVIIKIPAVGLIGL